MRARTARRIHRQASVQHDVANHLSWLCCVAAESDEQELRGLEEAEPALELRFVEAMVKVRRAIAEWRRQRRRPQGRRGVTSKALLRASELRCEEGFELDSVPFASVALQRSVGKLLRVKCWELQSEHPVKLLCDSILWHMGTLSSQK